MRFDWIIVGAGCTGATLAERLTTQLGRKVLVVDRRHHVGGNAFDGPDEHGLIIHPYGPHIFHTRLRRVWDYLSAFTKWRPYSHRVLAEVDGKQIPLPFNLNSLEMVFPAAEASALGAKLCDRYGEGANVPILRLLEETQGDLRRLGQYVYDNVFLGYTVKQWGLRPEELLPEVTNRVPVRLNRDDRYFTDEHQSMPADGFAAMLERMLDHRNIRLLLGTDFQDVAQEHRDARVVYTGAIDEYFSYRLGSLPYRSIRPRLEHYQVPFRQSVAVVNYPQDRNFTRITEFKHLTGQQGPETTLMVEYPEAHVCGQNERAYPIPQEANRRLYDRYAAEAAAQSPRLYFAGRLGNYQYYNMDQAIDRALQLFESKLRQ